MHTPHAGDFVIRPLEPADGPALSSLLSSQSPEYLRFFRPFGFDQDSISALLRGKVQDIYMGIFWEERQAGFFMLRGWDEGYEVPAYGVLIDEAHSGLGLATLSLRISKAICRLRRAPRIMLKVDDANVRARRVFELAGFVQTEVDPSGKVFIFHFDFDGSSKRF